MSAPAGEIAYTIRDAGVADARGVACVKCDTWRTTYRGIVPDKVLDEQVVDTWEARYAKGYAAPNYGVSVFSVVAESGTGTGTIVGFATGGKNRGDDPPGFDAELWAIYVLAAHQRAGLGARLVHALAERLIATGFRALVVWVLRDNAHGRAFYERLGGSLAGPEKWFDMDGTPCPEVGYVWRDLRSLLVPVPVPEPEPDLSAREGSAAP